MSPSPGEAGARTAFGFSERFRKGEYERTEQILDAMQAAGAQYLRTPLLWDEFQEPGGIAWYDWLLPKLGSRFELLPSIQVVPSSSFRRATSTGEPWTLTECAEFIGQVLARYGRHFRAVELQGTADGLSGRDWKADAGLHALSEMVGAAAGLVRQRGCDAVLGGPAPFEPRWLRVLGARGLLMQMTAIGLHAVAGDFSGDLVEWQGWEQLLATTRGIIDEFNPTAEIWITEAGHSTSGHDDVGELRSFVEALAAPADRLYWRCWQDASRQGALHPDLLDGQTGLVDAAGQPRLLGRLLREGGPDRVEAMAQLAAPRPRRPSEPIVVAGGAGFIGCNLADSYLAEGRDVLLLDNLSRPGVDQNLAWLKDRHGDRVHWQATDIRDEAHLRDALKGAAAIFHFAAQVAVTTSLEAPVADFEINARGTLNILEAVRHSGHRTPVIFASTNKVYGNLADLDMLEHEHRYIPADNAIAAQGIDESRNLDFCTPYGCSKGVADQYVLDYAKSYGIPTAVLRMSCIYGPRQFGTEDQGWVAHFLIRALRGEGITIYGNGKQVRDILHVRDAVAAYRALLAHIGQVKGQAFNLGGGPANSVSLRMVLREIARLVGREPSITYSETRQGDQAYFVANTQKLTDAVGWAPTIGWRTGIEDLFAWLSERHAPSSAQMAGAPEHDLLRLGDRRLLA